MPFVVSMVWREQTYHATDCYFCLTNIKGFSPKNKLKIVYLICNTALKSVPHRNDLPVPSPPSSEELESKNPQLNMKRQAVKHVKVKRARKDAILKNRL